MRTYFTADHHFGHDNILEFSKRPFANIREHDEALVDYWNEVVRPNDRVFHLGDFAYRSDGIHARRIFEKLHGQKFLVQGNHDKKHVRDLPWSSVEKLMDIAVEGQRLVLCHYALRTWPSIRRGCINLFGHSHGNLEGNAQSIDVGVDTWNFRPVDLNTIKARLATYPPLEFRDGDDSIDDLRTLTFALTPFDGELHVWPHEMPPAENIVTIRFRNDQGMYRAGPGQFEALRELLGTQSIKTVVRHDHAVGELEDLLTEIEQLVQRRVDRLQGFKP